MKKIVSLFILMVTSVFMFAQADSTEIANTISNANFILQFIQSPPIWLENAVIITGALLLATQTILSRIPTENSVKISGVIGKILDVLAFFPPDNKKGGGTH